MNTYLSYDDISLVAGYFSGNSRSNIITSVQIGSNLFRCPVVPANMKCVIDFELAETLAQNKYFYILHRFYSYDEIKNWIVSMNQKKLPVSISIGVSASDFDFIDWWQTRDVHIDYLTVDIAHGHCNLMKKMLNKLCINPKRAFVIAGNVMTKQAAIDLKSWGADMIKAGIGPGRACTTKLKTGFHSPMFSTVQECCSAGIPVIGDGGVRHNGDIFKALVAGAKLVMVGSLFSECVDSPAENLYDKNGDVIGKKYFGSASEHNKLIKKNIEGTLVHLPCNNLTILEKLDEIIEDLQSSISYSGFALDNAHKTKWIVHS